MRRSKTEGKITMKLLLLSIEHSTMNNVPIEDSIKQILHYYRTVKIGIYK